MVQYKRYEQYEDSGVEWIGEVPKGWGTGGLTKYVSSIVDYRGKTPEKVDEGVFLVTAKNIKMGKIDYSLSQEYVRSDEYEIIMRRGIPDIGDVVFTTEAPLGEVANIDRTDIALAQRIIKFRGIDNVLNNYYLKYWMLSKGFQDNLQTFATGSTATGIKASKLSKLLVLLPTYNEQTQIANFLDLKTAEIDSLIADKEKLIALLEEQRQAIITEVVTKGLNPDVKMKDSGVEWIGEIPKEWSISPFFTIFEESKIKNLGNMEQNVLSLSYGKIVRRDVESNFGLLPDSFETYQIIDNGTIVLRLTDLQNDKRSLRVGLAKERGIITSAYLALRAKYINAEYAYYLLHSYDLCKVFYGLGDGVRQSIGYADLKWLPIVLPSEIEQTQIVNFLDQKTVEIDELIFYIRTQLNNLKEYRQSLIFEAVTGKIDVRDVAAEVTATA
ncbi:restriction endonuclease subunit S [Brevibacillus sp. SAFN-007a]|uniref:restriction endonuclease subunit S n=1 Tax=Brevibacillus sp. SAFN-007a TaxID=3436862 RepID=UPI003F7FF6B0